jgi:fibronectin type 3 domain-containing protein
MGRLFVDRTAPIGQSATYRVVLTDDLGAPISPSIEREVESLAVVDASAPADLQLDNRGTLVRLDWSYPQPTSDRGDQVLRFEVLEVDSTSGRRRVVSTDETLLRNEAQSDFFYVFSVPAMGRTATYVVAAVQGTGRRIESEPMTFFIEDNVPPSTIGDVEVFMTPDENVEISWPVSPELDLAGYRLTRAQSLTDPFNTLNDSLLAPLQTIYTDSTTLGRRTYYYKVVAVDSSGNESTPSNPVMARVKDEAPPPTPDTLRAAIQDDGTVRLSWTALPPRDLYTYEAFYQRGGVGAEKAWARATDGVLVDTTVIARGIEGRGFADGARYRFGVAAVDSSLNRSDTAFVDLKIPDNTAPDAPPRLIVQNDGGVRALLRWTASGANDVTEYVLYRRPATPGVPDSVATPADTAFTRTDARRFRVRDDSAKAGQEYVYAVTAVDSLGNESVRTASRFTMRDLDPPPAVRNVQAVVQSDRGALVVWETPPGTDVVGYRLYRSDLPTGQFTPVTDEVLSERRYTDPEGSENTYYRVYALDTSGNVSDPSRPARAVPPRQ